jgi:hypothetical protein
MSGVRFEWDAGKATTNVRKHGVTFEEAATALRDPLAATGYDPDHAAEEDRYVTFGVSMDGRLLVVAHTERGGAVRIISARPASRSERTIYEEG